MAICVTCGNDYERTFEIIKAGQSYVFDCFECAIHQLAPECVECGCKILGHGIEAQCHIYCCAHCARMAGIAQAKDHV